MSSVRIIRLAFIVAIFIALFHSLAMVFYLYSFSWWLDIPLHLLGGFCVGLVSLYFYLRLRSRGSAPSAVRVFIAVLVEVLAIGIMWEIFEYYAGLTFNPVSSYTFDTTKDLVMDVLGGCATYLYYVKVFKKN